MYLNDYLPVFNLKISTENMIPSKKLGMNLTGQIINKLHFSSKNKKGGNPL
jgi:hypothetical protein